MSKALGVFPMADKCLVFMLLLVVPTGVTEGNAALGTVHICSEVWNCKMQ